MNKVDNYDSYVVVVVVELPQTLEDDLRSVSYAWKADELVTVGAWV